MKLSSSSETAIALTFLVMNLNTLLTRVSCLLLNLFWQKLLFALLKLIRNENKISFIYQKNALT